MSEHQYTHLEINVSNIRHNLRYFRSFLSANSKLLVLVKAYGYGHGIGEFSRILEDNGVDYLAVAFPGEGVAIREAGVRLPVIVLSSGMEHYPLLIRNRLEPSLPCLEAFQRFVREASALGQHDYPVHIKLDTGMHRLGFEKAELEALTEELPLARSVRIASVSSHILWHREIPPMMISPGPRSPVSKPFPHFFQTTWITNPFVICLIPRVSRGLPKKPGTIWLVLGLAFTECRMLTDPGSDLPPI